jgi:predicted nucleic acid-binding Zn ribbon protein
MRGLIGSWEAMMAFSWPVARRYVLRDGKIRPDFEAGELKPSLNSPLTDSDLFPSFSRLGALGDGLSEDAILRWVHKYGLLQVKDPNANLLAAENQAPVTPSEFREEASHAYKASTLLNAIHSEDYGALRSRISCEPIDPPRGSGESRPAYASGPAYVYVDGLPILMMRARGGEPTDKMVRTEAKFGLESFVSLRLKRLDLVFDAESGHPRPHEVYRPKLVVHIPDLWRAIWYQFALLMSDTRPVKYCEVCEGPIFRPRSDQTTCSARCRKRKSRLKAMTEIS